jgi:hypothetical protein
MILTISPLSTCWEIFWRAPGKRRSATCFLRIAEHYREREVRLKAIAMYKKVREAKAARSGNRRGSLATSTQLTV